MTRSISTRAGDEGTTGLLYGQRVPKDHPQMMAVGACDELNAALGLAKAALLPALKNRRADIERIQKNLVAIMGEVVCAEADLPRYEKSNFQKLTDAELAHLDETAAELEARRHDPFDWATPGTNAASAALDFARTITRRFERQLVALPASGRHPRPLLLRYANRLSDLLWLLARESANTPPSEP
jgi:cob(I)alamin adenosyltransferase